MQERPYEVVRSDDADEYADQLNTAHTKGYMVLNCGVNFESGHDFFWAILMKKRAERQEV